MYVPEGGGPVGEVLAVPMLRNMHVDSGHTSKLVSGRTWVIVGLCSIIVIKRRNYVLQFLCTDVQPAMYR